MLVMKKTSLVLFSFRKSALNSSIDGYLVLLEHSPCSVPSGEGGSARLMDTEEDPASTYLNLDAFAGNDSNGVENELPRKYEKTPLVAS